MVLLTMTSAIVAALKKLQDANYPTEQATKAFESDAQELDKAPSVLTFKSEGPPLSSPELGAPISHSQVLELSAALQKIGQSQFHLDSLLKGSQIYIPPPPPKPETTPEYKALMARLRFEAESNAYARMTAASDPLEAFTLTTSPSPFSSSTAPVDDAMSMAEINQQTTLIFNVLVSILACAAAIWTMARWWDTPARLALTMVGSILVGVAEVVVYTGYLRKVGEARKKESKLKERKQVVKSWTIAKENSPVGINNSIKDSDPRLRRRKKEGT